MSRRFELPTPALTALTQLSGVTNDEFDQLPQDRISHQLHTARDLASSLNGLPAPHSISRQGTPTPLEQNPCFQQLQQRVQNLTNEREALAKERDALTEEHDAIHQQKKKVTRGPTLCSLCVRRSRRTERKLAFWVCRLLLCACGQGSMPPGRS